MADAVALMLGPDSLVRTAILVSLILSVCGRYLQARGLALIVLYKICRVAFGMRDPLSNFLLDYSLLFAVFLAPASATLEAWRDRRSIKRRMRRLPLQTTVDLLRLCQRFGLRPARRRPSLSTDDRKLNS